jgi:hypothetical protein
MKMFFLAALNRPVLRWILPFFLQAAVTGCVSASKSAAMSDDEAGHLREEMNAFDRFQLKKGEMKRLVAALHMLCPNAP